MTHRTENVANKPNAVQTAREAVLAARGKLAEWQTTLAAAESELADLEGRTGEQALDDPEIAFSIPRRMQEQRDRIGVAKKVITVQAARVRAAERDYLLTEASVLERKVVAARQKLERHEARTKELLAQLEAHEGPYTPEGPVLYKQWLDGSRGGVFRGPTYTSDALRDEIRTAERPVQIIRAMAEGRNLSDLFQEWNLDSAGARDLYPACVWGPDVLVPAPGYLRAVEWARNEVDAAIKRHPNLEANVVRCERELEEALVHYDENGRPRSRIGSGLSPDDDAHPARHQARVQHARRLVEENLQERKRAETALAELVGQPTAEPIPTTV
ncbi:hypothetical protein [Nocardioides antri]|uniref:Uncharacterized protein n=1 Tax=Nocardioides antri TaxID=2607659 RepID=A0A5B1M3Z2_9ACTN|nr:hypothetical protein [Nocardioides antri]KAA1426460.1 hypothetical protein F0U47_13740 [Nocardioides antri]